MVMMGIIRRLILFVPIAALVAGAGAMRGDAQGTHFQVYGAGSLPCERWTTDRAQGGENFRVELSWVLGFVTAFQWNAEDGMEDTNVAAMDAFMSKYCHDHPLQNVSDAASALAAELRFRGTAP
jgi:hypothetical protein